MGVSYNPKITTNDLVIVADARNPKSVTSSTSQITNAAGGSNNFTGSGLNVLLDSDAGNVISLEGGAFTAAVSPVIHKYSYSVICWIKYQAGKNANYTNIWEFDTSDNAVGYYMRCDTRTTSSPSILFFVKDHTSSSWATDSIITNAEWLNSTTWFCIAVTQAQESEFKTYLNGKLHSTVATSSQDLSGYGDIDQVQIGSTNNSGARLGHFSVYKKVLTASEIKENFEAMRGRFNI